ncbi:MAG: hypothetical protein O2976_04110 [Actinomycetota bacterium]|nr:hypothetical protein [Actinomycetota bacterium]
MTTPDTPPSARGFLGHTSRDAVISTIVAATVLAAEAVVVSEWGSWQFLASLVVTVLVLWFAEVFSDVLVDATTDPFRVRLARAGNYHWAVLEAAVPLAIPLILGGIGVLSEKNAVFAALLVAVGALGIWGGIASRQRGSGWPQAVVAAVASALIGVTIILLKSFY